MINSIKSAFGLDTIPEVTTYFGIVRYAFPWLNLYVVEPDLNGSIGKSMRLVSGSDSISRMGEITHAYAVGDAVIVATDYDSEISSSTTDYIICHASAINTTDIQGPTNSMVSVSKFQDMLSNVFNKLRACLCGSLKMLSKKRYTHPTDMLCGDTNIGGSPGNNISVLKHITKIQCGKKCFVELDSVLSRIRIVTESMEYIGPLKHHHDMSGKGSLMEYNQTAISREEGTLGLFDDSGRRPVFRKKEASGDITSGWQTSVSVPDIDTGASDDVYSSKVRYDGEMSVISAKGFEIKKSLNIVTAYQKRDQHSLGDTYREADEFPNIVNNETRSQENIRANRSLTIDEDNNARNESEFPRVISNPDGWGLSSDLRTDAVAEAVSESRTLPNIGSSQQYDLPGTIEIKDPHTGQTYTYFKSESGFRQDPDGSITLYDGYGSEIRMTRGNIIISAAADVIVRPGRDFHTMAGGHLAMVAQDDVILHSSNKNAYIKGNKNVSILSGIDEEGKTIIDDRGSGVLVRSKSKASLVANDVFVGSIPPDPEAITAGATKGTGTVTIGGGDTTVVTGNKISVYGEYIDAIAHKEKDVSWVSIDTNRIVGISENLYVTGEMYIGHIAGTLSTTVGNQTLRAGNQNKKSQLHVQAPMDACYGVSCRQLWAEQVLGVRVYAGNAHDESGIRAIVKKPTINSKAPIMTQAYTISARCVGPWSDYFNIQTGFKYPSSAELGIDGYTYTVPGILWQKYLKGGKVWSEGAIPDFVYKDTSYMVYPGAEAWNGTISMGSNSNISLKGGYKINGRD